MIIHKINIFKMALMVLLTASMFHVGAYAATEIKWQDYNKKTIFAESKKEHKPILLFVKADWCPHCQIMRKTTLRDDSVVKMVNGSFVPVLIDADKDKKIAQSYKVTGLPSFIVLNSNDKEVAKFAGEYSIMEFMQNLSDAHRKFKSS